MFTRSDRPRPNTKFSRLSGTESDKSFVDDFDMERGIVSMRVGLSYDLLRLSPCSGDLYTANCAGVSRNRNSLAPPKPKQKTKQNKTKTKSLIYKNTRRGVVYYVYNEWGRTERNKERTNKDKYVTKSNRRNRNAANPGTM